MYIKREAAIDLLHYHADEACSSVVTDFETIPAADVVEVVRCENCQHNPEFKRFKGMVWCRKFHTDVHRDGFCSYGERKGGECG